MRCRDRYMVRHNTVQREAQAAVNSDKKRAVTDFVRVVIQQLEAMGKWQDHFIAQMRCLRARGSTTLLTNFSLINMAVCQARVLRHLNVLTDSGTENAVK